MRGVFPALGLEAFFNEFTLKLPVPAAGVT